MSATRAQILSSFLDEGRRTLDSSGAIAFLKENSVGALTLAAQSGISEALARRIGELRFEGTDVTDFPDFSRQLAAAFEPQTLIALPLRVGDELVGGIGFAFPGAHPSDRAERERVELVAARAEVAMERARLLEERQTPVRFNEAVAGVLAHDLRNPLAAILMNARMLRSAESERSRTIGGRIVTSGDRMSRMIDQMLEWARLRASPGGLDLRRTRCDLAALANDVVGALRARKPEVPISLSAEGDVVGQWDADRLAQVVSNLVANAAEHASRPGVSIRLSADGELVRLAVENEGRIDAELVPLVFQPFRGRTAGGGGKNRGAGRGIGLGLYITREIVAAHGGRVELEHVAPRVAFIMTLPRAAAP
jgi:signal transduction histidine kinase